MVWTPNLLIRIIGAALCGTASGTLLFIVASYAQRWWVREPECGDDERIGALNALAALAIEWAAVTVAVITWPLARAMRTHGATVPSACSPIVLLHGWGFNTASLWLLRRRLQRAGLGPVSLFRYRTRGIPIETAAEGLRGFVAEVAHLHKGPITLIGHGLGGLVGRYYLRRYPPHGVRRLVTLGTPHHGTAAARNALGLRRLRPDSALIKQLSAGDRVPDQFDVIAISSPFDALVVPRRCADYPGACNIEIRAVGHTALLFSPRVVTLIGENLRPAASSAGTRS